MSFLRAVEKASNSVFFLNSDRDPFPLCSFIGDYDTTGAVLLLWDMKFVRKHVSPSHCSSCVPVQSMFHVKEEPAAAVPIGWECAVLMSCAQSGKRFYSKDRVGLAVFS